MNFISFVSVYLFFGILFILSKEHLREKSMQLVKRVEKEIGKPKGVSRKKKYGFVDRLILFLFLISAWPMLAICLLYGGSIIDYLVASDSKEPARPFADKYIVGECEFQRIHEYLDIWSRAPGNLSPWTYLGVSEVEYEAFLKHPPSLKEKLDKRRRGSGVACES